MFGQFGAVKFEKVWVCMSEEVIMVEDSFDIFCSVVKGSLFKLLREDGDCMCPYFLTDILVVYLLSS